MMLVVARNEGVKTLLQVISTQAFHAVVRLRLGVEHPSSPQFDFPTPYADYTIEKGTYRR